MGDGRRRIVPAWTCVCVMLNRSLPGNVAEYVYGGGVCKSQDCARYVSHIVCRCVAT